MRSSLASFGMLLALVAGGVAAAQELQPHTRLLRSAPLQKAEAAIEADATAPARQPSARGRVRVPLRDGTTAIENDARTGDASAGAAAPAPRPRARVSRQDLAAAMNALGVVAPYDLSASGKYLIATDRRGGGLVLCDLAARRRLRTLENSDRRYTLLKISADARWIAGVRRDNREHIDVWRADKGLHSAALIAAGDAKQKLEFTADGSQLRVTDHSGDGLVFSIPAGQVVGRFGSRDGGTVRQPGSPAPQLAPRIGAAPDVKAPEPQFRSAPYILAPEEDRSAQDTTKSFAAPPKAATPSIEPPAVPQIDAPSEPAAAPRATVRSAPRMAAPRTSQPQPQLAPPVAAPAAPQTTSPEPIDDAGPQEPAAGAPAPTFDDVRSALPTAPAEGEAGEPETGAAPPPAAAAAPRETDFAPAEPAAAAPPEIDAMPPEPAAAAPREAVEEAEAEASAAPDETAAGETSSEEPRTAAAPPPKAPDPSSVLVHYATNRNRLAPKDREWLVYFRGFFSTLPAFVVYALMLLAVLIFPWFGKRVWVGYALTTGLVVLGAMGTLEAYVRSQLRDELTGELFGSRPTELSYGACEISVPLAKNRQPGELNRPVSVWVFEAPENPEKHFMLRRVVEHADKDAFYRSLSAEVEKSGTESALLFLHGYNVSFEDALFRTAQLTVDLKFPGAAIAFSWPSYGDPVKYTFDEQHAEVSIPALRELVQDLTTRSGAARIHVIAHSMGNRVLAGALRTMDRESQERNKRVIREIVLAAPDIDRRVFESQVLPHIAENTQHCTLYASSRDRALLISRYFHNYQRLGETEPELIVAHGMDTIDASLVDTSLLGHSYIGDVQSIVSDLHELVVAGKRPIQRLGLEALERGELVYWTIKPRLETATDGSLRR